MAREAVLFETDEGIMVVDGDEVLLSERVWAGAPRAERLRAVGERAKQMGISRLRVSTISAKEAMEDLGIEVAIIADEEKERLDGRKAELLARAGLAWSEGPVDFEKARAGAIAAAERQVSEASSKEDLHLVNAIQALDELDKFVNVTTERTMEWYSLHFPELPELLGDNLALAKMITETAERGRFDAQALERQGFSPKKAEAMALAAERSKGGSISERDLRRVVGLAELSIKANAEREKLAETVESTMNKIAPNITSVVGATIGARLIARAGGLERMARLPASTIQVLGAEKALFRAIRTGSRPPKHGILFQHEAVHTAPKWQRGKIARTLANKIAIAARIDYYRGEKAGDLTGLLEKRLSEIKIKYKEAPAKWQKGQGETRPPRGGPGNVRRGRGDRRPSQRSRPRWKNA